MPGDYLAFEFFQVWEGSGYAVLPFAGAWSDQPSWVREAFLTLLSVKHWHSINDTLPVADGLLPLDKAM